MTEDAGSNNRRIARNAVMLYIRMGLSMIVGLYTSRVVLATLGVSDYGIYGVVGGIVGMMGFLNASMAGATSRFITFELGRGDEERLRKTFSSALIVHFGISLVILLLAETVGLWFLENKLVIPEGRMDAARWVYQLSILSAVISIPQAPYSAVLIAHEKMDIYAYFELLNVGLKLLIVYLLQIGDFDKLILYAVLTFAVSVFMIMLYRVYCIRHYSEARFRWIWDKTYLRPLLSFSGWDLYGNFSFSVRQQGSQFILNNFYGTIINAASGVAATVQGILLSLCSNVTTAFKPAIIKKYAANDIVGMNKMICFGSKLSFLLLLFFTLPILFKTEYVLQLWLKNVPDGAVFMTKMSLLMNLFSCYNGFIIIGIHASGKVAMVGFICGTIYILSLPVMYLLLHYGFTYRECYLLFVLIAALFCFIDIAILKHNIRSFSITRLLKSSLLPMTVVSMASYVIVGVLCNITYISDGIIGLLICSLMSWTSLFVLFYFIALNGDERKRISGKLSAICSRLGKR